ncbi:hypothetical protein EVAR_94877_1 [Eumeta japonica]|uniref:Uncharacterized protein n=1 Tax=Eumeta variegata TaxID=151549 RepID=A0A4C1V9R0_EUMVA|nr:hypothetical protein EVAR_94877_1 [Eumeta japonica]
MKRERRAGIKSLLQRPNIGLRGQLPHQDNASEHSAFETKLSEQHTGFRRKARRSAGVVAETCGSAWAARCTAAPRPRNAKSRELIRVPRETMFTIDNESTDPDTRCCARGRPIIVEWERDARHSAGLSLVRFVAMSVRCRAPRTFRDLLQYDAERVRRRKVCGYNARRKLCNAVLNARAGLAGCRRNIYLYRRGVPTDAHPPGFVTSEC